MINRRILRVKAMKAMYAYKVLKESLREIYREELVSKYELDPAVHDFSEKNKFVARQNLINEVFHEYFTKQDQKRLDTLESDVQKDITVAFEEFNGQLQNEARSLKTKMVEEVNNISKLYVKLLLIPGEFAFFDRQEKEKDQKSLTRKTNNCHNLDKNSAIEELYTHGALTSLATKNGIDWKNEIDVLKQWFRDIIRKNDDFIDYQHLNQIDRQDDLEILRVLFKRIIFKDEVIDAYFSESDLQWTENKSILKSMVLKTVKSMTEGELELRELSYNQEEDFSFFKDLFSQTIERESELEGYIDSKTKNWDISRIAALDIIILQMAIMEMILFPSIPVKVTINEFIEISKNYSTPKSKQFINGILDVLANELTSEGVIKKSGRGLIDNK